MGSLALNAGSAVVGLYVWNGNEILQAKLLPTVTTTALYDSLSRSVSQPLTGLYPATLARLGDTTYNLTLYPILPNNVHKVRLRYLVPFNVASGVAAIPLNPVFNGNMSITVSGADTESVVINRDGVRSSYRVPFTLSSQAVASLSLELGNMNGASSLRTAFSSGDYKGNYWLLNQAIPDSVLDKSEIRREIVIM